MTATDIAGLLAATVLLALAMTGAWAVRMRTGNSGWIDAIWSAAIGVGGLVAVVMPAPGATGRRWLVAALLVAWSARLAGHIAARTRNAGDDPRYAELAREWGATFPRRLFVFLQVQAAAGVVLVVAIRLAATNPAPFPGVLDVVAAALSIAAIVGEAVSDAGLARFRRGAPPRGAICTEGPWGWSRHPNYFFEWLVWCAVALFAIDPTGGHPIGLLALAAPVLMYVLLVHVSGIPPLESHMLSTRGDAWRTHCARISAFFPRPPRRASPRSIHQGGHDR